jgi:hypothetical protein
MTSQFGLRFRLPRKSATWDRRLYFPSEGRFEPAILGTRGQHANHYTTDAAVQGRYVFMAGSIPALRCHYSCQGEAFTRPSHAWWVSTHEIVVKTVAFWGPRARPPSPPPTQVSQHDSDIVWDADHTEIAALLILSLFAWLKWTSWWQINQPVNDTPRIATLLQQNLI